MLNFIKLRKLRNELLPSKRYIHPLPNYFQRIFIYKMEHPAWRKWHSHPSFIFRRILFWEEFSEKLQLLGLCFKENKFTFVSTEFSVKNVSLSHEKVKDFNKIIRSGRSFLLCLAKQYSLVVKKMIGSRCSK